MEKVEMNSNRGTALMCFAIGLGTGIALMAVLAPRSGAATRRLIRRKVEGGKDWMTVKAVSAQDYVKDHGKEFSDRFKDVAEVIGRH